MIMRMRKWLLFELPRARATLLHMGAALILIISGFTSGSIKPCLAESEASSSASSEAGSEAGLIGRRRHWWYRQQQMNERAQANKQEMRHEAQVRMQEQKADNRRIARPDRDFVRNYRGSGRHRLGGTPPQVQVTQPAQPASQFPQTIK